MLTQPFFGAMCNIHPAAFHAAITRAALGQVLREIVVEIESPVQARRQSLAVQDHCADEGCRDVPLLLESLRQGHGAGTHWIGKIHYSVVAGIKPGQDAGVRRVGDGADGERILEADAVARQAVEGRCLRLLVAVATHVVGAQRIQRNEEDVWLGVLRSGGCWRRRFFAGGGACADRACAR